MSTKHEQRRERELAEIARKLNAFWKWTPRDEEFELLADETKHWPNLADVAEAVDYASRNFDERPAMAWVLQEARRRRRARQQSREQALNDQRGAACGRCGGERWVQMTLANIDEFPERIRNANKQALEDDYGPMLIPCLDCAPEQHELWQSGAYALDSTGSKDESRAHILAKYRSDA